MSNPQVNGKFAKLDKHQTIQYTEFCVVVKAPNLLEKKVCFFLCFLLYFKAMLSTTDVKFLEQRKNSCQKPEIHRAS